MPDPLQDLDPRTPVLVGVGQASERLEDDDYRGLSPVDLAAVAAEAALADAGVTASSIRTVAATRQFETSTPGAPAPLGRSTSFPLSVCERLGVRAERVVLEVAGGQSPQHLVNEFAREIAAGRTDAVLLVGAEAISTARHLSATDDPPDWTEEPAGESEDRGLGLKGLITRHQVLHGLIDAPSQYSLLENARRASTGQSRAEYAAAMGALLAPFTEVAARNPHSFAPDVRTAEELAGVDERNRRITDPYPRFMVARELVNQAAAVVLTSLGRARELGVPEDRLVFLHGQADLREQDLFARPDLGHAPSAGRAVAHALELAGAGLDDVAAFDLYSCFPVAVSHVCDQLGLAPDDPRGLTLAGGLPFFGGAGNNYSMHAIAEAVTRVRAEPGSLALVLANGGALSKCSVGVYGARPVPHRADRSAALQQELDAQPVVEQVAAADGWAVIETWTLGFSRSGRRRGLVVGRLEADGRRFLAGVEKGDEPMLDLLEHEDQPEGTRVFARSFGYGNRVTTSEERMAELFPARERGLRAAYDHLEVRRDGHLLEVTLNRPGSDNMLHPPAHEELDEVFDAYLADPDLWVAILTGAGEQAFCAGSDLLYGLSGNPVYVPANGFGGLTSRRDLTKPVIAAVNGLALGGGFELALACHLVVADERAEFALGEVRHGLVADNGGLVRLARALPPALAHEIVLTGRRVGVREAQGLGLVNRVADAGRALEVARRLAADLLESSPTSVRTALAMLEHGRPGADPADALELSSGALDDLVFSQDALEGMTALAEGRPPVWRNL